jgi:hypothetical protein
MIPGMARATFIVVIVAVVQVKKGLPLTRDDHRTLHQTHPIVPP